MSGHGSRLAGAFAALALALAAGAPPPAATARVAPAGASEPSDGLLAFSAQVRGRGQVFLAGADGSGRRQLTSAAVNHGKPAWSPDGTSLLYATDVFPRPTGPSRVVIHTIATGARTTVASIPDASFGDLFHGLSNPAWAPGADAIAYKDPDYEIAVRGAGPGAEQTRTLAAGDEPAWSPDGSLIAFTRLSIGPQADGSYLRSRGIWTITPGGRELRPLTRGNDWDADWSPDGTRIAFTRVRGGRRFSSDVLVVSPGAARTRRITSGRGAAWSPDGRRIAFVRDRGIYVARADGSRAARVLARRLVLGIDWQPAA